MDWDTIYLWRPIDLTEPRVLVYDLETAPNLGYAWSKWETDLLEIPYEWYILCFAYKWLGDSRVHSVALPDFPDAYAEDPRDDFYVVNRLHHLFEEADITVTHNGVTFDQPKAYTRMLVHNMPPPSGVKEIDTLKVARRQFAFPSNKLDDLCRSLGMEGKAETGGFQTWAGCMDGNPKAWKKMVTYNKQDVVILENLYLRLVPWIKNHPNLAAMSGRPQNCPRCNTSGPFQARGWQYYQVTRRQKFQCNNCGGYSLGRELDKLPVEHVSA